MASACRSASKRAKIQKRRPWKSLRATFATRKHTAGYDAQTLAAMMGLSLAHVLEHYVKVDQQRLEEAMSVPVATGTTQDTTASESA